MTLLHTTFNRKKEMKATKRNYSNRMGKASISYVRFQGRLNETKEEIKRNKKRARASEKLSKK